MKKYVIILLFLMILGCANKAELLDSESSDSHVDLVIAMPTFEISVDVFNAVDPIDLDNRFKDVFAEFDIPLTITPRVNYYLKYYTGSGRNVMQNWLNRSNKYVYLVRQRFIQEGIPTDLLVLAFTESGYNPIAYSKAGAGGMWQFMPGTGKSYGLKINEWVDERRDFEKATDAAARHLKDLNNSFNDWYLSLAAYNAGQGRIVRAAQKHKSQDFFTIASTKTLNLETRDYVPKYLAQLIIYKNMKEYGFEEPKDLPLVFRTVTVKKQINLYVYAKVLGVSYADLVELNPELLLPITPPVESYSLRVPSDKYDIAMAALKDPNLDLSRYKYYRAKSGETLSGIAKKFGVSVASIKTINNISYDKIYSSVGLFIPNKNVVIGKIDQDFAKVLGRRSPKYYTVKKGDNMLQISKKYNIPLKTLFALNPKVDPKKMYPGQVIVISQGS